MGPVSDVLRQGPKPLLRQTHKLREQEAGVNGEVWSAELAIWHITYRFHKRPLYISYLSDGCLLLT